MCRFDRDYFGNFLGQATVEYKRTSDAERAVKEYHGAFLDDRVLTVEFDVGTSSPESFPGPAKDISSQKGGNAAKSPNAPKPAEASVKKINLSSQTNGKKKNIRI
uniref:RRM domain-containing protein n=1 Tax=Strombidium inclinatum TaxID=197538 RepID=A0A7S3MVY0_9SPIT|mmetsp:Transcript_12897/g.19987  ORF Transcript_12897/g.19987 Transcript_12897/m.19987 type:complete len:105 (+) Transcript_12897:585-899(+)